MFAGLTLALAVIYRYGPSCEALGAVLLVRVQFGKFNETNGSLGRGYRLHVDFRDRHPAGAAPSSTPREHQTARDTTTGFEVSGAARRPVRAGLIGLPMTPLPIFELRRFLVRRFKPRFSRDIRPSGTAAARRG